LQKFDYQPTRQIGSHIRLTTNKNGIHHITIPSHSQIKIGNFVSYTKRYCRTSWNIKRSFNRWAFL